MGHTPYGYKIENGKAVVDEKKAEQIRELFNGYLSGLSLKEASEKSGIGCYHATAGKILQNESYLGDKYYPQIIDEEIFKKAGWEKQSRAEKLGRIWETKNKPEAEYAVKFKMGRLERKFEDPFKQAEYVYSLIESEVL
jgi:hypothetical protein